ncbi:MAG: hypothetical protein IJM94_01560 [Clostridia bacterium]|nr:hypothetical protein [Clostridia bacterium]
MSVFSDEMILYTGLIVAAVSVLSGILYFAVYAMRKHKLNEKFNVEYGKVQKEK